MDGKPEMVNSLICDKVTSLTAAEAIVPVVDAPAQDPSASSSGRTTPLAPVPPQEIKVEEPQSIKVEEPAPESVQAKISARNQRLNVWGDQAKKASSVPPLPSDWSRSSGQRKPDRVAEIIKANLSSADAWIPSIGASRGPKPPSTPPPDSVVAAKKAPPDLPSHPPKAKTLARSSSTPQASPRLRRPRWCPRGPRPPR